MEIQDVKRYLGVKNQDIADAFGYKNRNSYQKSSRKKKIEAGIVWTFEKCVEEFKNMPKL